jgi:ribonucleotide reductase alpha subunit
MLYKDHCNRKSNQ